MLYLQTSRRNATENYKISINTFHGDLSVAVVVGSSATTCLMIIKFTDLS